MHWNPLKAQRAAFAPCVLLALALAFPACAQPARVLSDFAIARPVIAAHGMVVSQEAAASRIGVDILKRGGNAVDAAVAVGFALAVTLPVAGNIGGGGFMLIHRADLHKTIAIDYRETAPALTTKDVFLDDKGEADPEKSLVSGLGVGVPGTVAGLELAWRKYGSGRFSFADLIAPGGEARARGADRRRRPRRYAAARRAAAGAASRLGAHLPQTRRPRRSAPATISRSTIWRPRSMRSRRKGRAPFTKGRSREKIVAAVRQAGGRMTLDDLRNYRAVEREPVRGTYRGHEIVSMPPPSSGGVHVIEILNILEGYPLARAGAQFGGDDP